MLDSSVVSWHLWELGSFIVDSYVFLPLMCVWINVYSEKGEAAICTIYVSEV